MPLAFTQEDFLVLITGLTLVSAPHLARSYHHLFPLPIFIDVQRDHILSEHR